MGEAWARSQTMRVGFARRRVHRRAAAAVADREREREKEGTREERKHYTLRLPATLSQQRAFFLFLLFLLSRERSARGSSFVCSVVRFLLSNEADVVNSCFLLFTQS